MSAWLYPLVLGLCIGAALMLVAVRERLNAGIYVPCAVAEVSPDVPAKAKEECRRRKQ